LSVETYLKTRAVSGPWQIEGCTEGGFSGAVVIPALAESANLFATLSSLADNPAGSCEKILVLVVVNQREDATQGDKDDNLTTRHQLASGKEQPAHLNLAWVDACTPGRELPIKGGGVGLARKIGLDLALSRLNTSDPHAFLACLDADTLVRPDYLPALREHFHGSRHGAAIIPFIHQKGLSEQADRAITWYELFLRCYVLGLSRAGSPYAFHTVGSSMACRADAYAKIGGMNSRSAGEDFYFLQQLARTVGVRQVAGTVVYPSQRASHRVPFGTGRSISRILEGDTSAALFYHCGCYKELGAWLNLVTTNLHREGDWIMGSAEGISTPLADYLTLTGFEEIWGKLRRNNPRPEVLLNAFHGWFDGLKTMKLIHHLSAGPYPRCHPGEAVPELLEWCGLAPASELTDQLELLRKLQLGPDYP
jgi:hypothetical protein